MKEPSFAFRTLSLGENPRMFMLLLSRQSKTRAAQQRGAAAVADVPPVA